MGKKKFIDKKKSATFHLMARDSSDPNYSPDPLNDRVFVRVDNNPYNFDEADQNSVFADAVDDINGDVNGVKGDQTTLLSLPDNVRREILELGFPDDGYNYLSHLREIKNNGGGSAYYENPKADFELLSNDVKAYDASRVEVSRVEDVVVEEEKLMYSVAAKTVGVRLQRVVDAEVAKMLEDGESETDVEDLDEDFVVRANEFEGGVFDDGDEDEDEGEIDELGGGGGGVSSGYGARDVSASSGYGAHDVSASGARDIGATVLGLGSEQARPRRALDEQFDMLELQEYGTESEEEYNDFTDEENEGQESLAQKLNHAFKNHPSDLLLHNKKAGDDIEPPEVAAEVIQRCKEYAEKYENDNDEEVEFVEESSDESEVWDCETVVTTYSTLDNHPGKIGVPERRKKKLAEALSGASAVSDRVIALKGKERLPVDFLPRSKKHVEDKLTGEKDENSKQTEQQKKKPRSQESKEEKKERKSTVKSERREARQMKKEMKGLYKSEAHRAQKVAAFTGPSSIHLM